MAPLTGIAYASNWLISKLNLNSLSVKTTRVTTNDTGNIKLVLVPSSECGESLQIIYSSLLLSNSITTEGTASNPPNAVRYLGVDSWPVNHKKTHRIYCLEGLNLWRKRPRRHVSAAHRQQRLILSGVGQC